MTLGGKSKSEKNAHINKKNIGKNPIGDCEQNNKGIETNKQNRKNSKWKIEIKVQLENGNKSPIRKWK